MGLKTKIIALCLLSTTANAGYEEYYENMEASNEAMKTCLLAHGYDGTVFFSYAFEKAAACHGKWKTKQLTEEYVKTRLWLQENPWFTGSNWNWQEIAKEYPGKENVKKW